MTDYGTLLVRVYTSRAEIPIEGATVAVTQPKANHQHTLLAVRSTDESGRIEPISISTPPKNDSQEPHAGPVFATCDLWIEHPQYEMLFIEGVQLFSGVETLQDAALMPLAEHAIPRNESVQIEITPQPL